jgi:hypothetical protein
LPRSVHQHREALPVQGVSGNQAPASEARADLLGSILRLLLTVFSSC